MAGDLRISMLLTANASQAKSEVASYKSSIDDLATSAIAGGNAATSAASDIKLMSTASAGTASEIAALSLAGVEWGSAVQMIRAAMNPLVAEHQQLQQAARELTLAEEIGAITSREAALAYDQLQRQMTELERSMAAAGTSIDGTTSALTRHDTAVQAAIGRVTGLTSSTENSASAQLRHGLMLDDLRAKFDPLFAASRRYEIELREIAEAERLGAMSATIAAEARQRAAAAMAPMSGYIKGITASAGAATQMTANLGFQVNDIVMMATTGQAPLMLMMQQGSQVTQIFQQMRAGGLAIGPAIASSVRAILSPMSLVTFAAIGASAAMIQWLTGVGSEVPSVTDLIDELTQSVNAYTSAANAASVPTADLIAKYGALSDVARRALQDIAAADRAEALQKVRATVENLTQKFGGLNTVVDDLGMTLSDGLSASDLMREFDLLPEAALRVVTGLRALNGAEGLDAQARAAQEIRDALIAIYGTAEQASAGPFAEMFRQMAQISEQAALIEAADEARSAPARQLLEELQQENELRALILEYGVGSVEVTQARAAAEAAAREELWDSKGASEELKVELRAAHEQALELARLEMSAGIAGATAEAQLLAATLGVALGVAKSILNLKAQPKLGFGLPGVADPVIGGVPTLTFGSNPGRTSSSRDPSFNSYVPKLPARSASGRGSGGGSGASEIDKQRKALDDLIERQERELELLRETDPVRKEMLRNREALAGATEAERAKVEALIEARMRETEVMESMKWVSEQSGNALIDALMGADDAGKQLIETLIRATLQAALLGEGPLAGLFGGMFGGGSGGGGLLSGLFSFNPFDGAYADGGKLQGQGGPRDDNLLVWASSGEFMVNAAATARHQPVLEAINAGASPAQIMALISGGQRVAFADGGLIGASAPAAWRLSSSGGGIASGDTAGSEREGSISVSIDLRGAMGDKAIEDRAYIGMQRALAEYDRQVLPRRVKALRADPRKIG